MKFQLTSVLMLGLAGVLSAMVVPASAQVTLKRVLPSKQTISANADSVTEQVLTLAGMNIESKSEQNIVSSAEFSAAQDGKVSVKHKVNSIQLRVKAQGMEFAFDSANPEKGSDSEIGKQIAAALKVTLIAEWTSIHDLMGKVLEIKGAEKFLEGLDAPTAAMVKGQLDPDYLKERIVYESNRIPAKPIKVGDTWELSDNVRIGGGQTLSFKHEFKYAGTVNKDGKQMHRIEVTAKDVTYTLGADSPLPLKLKNSDLKPVESKGELLFDTNAGRIVEENNKVRIKGKITFAVGEQELPGELDLTLTTTSKERP